MDYPLGKASFAHLGKDSNKKKIIPGTYDSTIVAIVPAQGWAEGKAFEFTYKLKSDSSEAEKKEVFVNSLKNFRTLGFVEYLAKNGVEIESLEEVLGLKEQLTFEFDEINGVKYLNITMRKYVGFENISKDVEEVDDN